MSVSRFRSLIGLKLLLIPLSAILCGCPVTQPQATPVSAVRIEESAGKCGYWLYVPNCYNPSRLWPMVVTLHGTHGWDSSRAQIREWKYLAEQHGFIVVAPDLHSVQGILPVVESWWLADLQADERNILAVMDEVMSSYAVDPQAVLLTGFSAGGYPLYHVGLRNSRRFNMLIARSCNSSRAVFESAEITDDLRSKPIVILWGKDEMKAIVNDSWAAFRHLREQGCTSARAVQIRGGHLRRPELAYKLWAQALPPQYRP